MPLFFLVSSWEFYPSKLPRTVLAPQISSPSSSPVTMLHIGLFSGKTTSHTQIAPFLYGFTFIAIFSSMKYVFSSPAWLWLRSHSQKGKINHMAQINAYFQTWISSLSAWERCILSMIACERQVCFESEEQKKGLKHFSSLILVCPSWPWPDRVPYFHLWNKLIHHQSMTRMALI